MQKKHYIWGTVCAVFMIGYLFRPTIVVRENYMAGGPNGFSAGRGIASVGSVGATSETKFEAKADGNLLRATQHFCDKNFHQESCLSFLIQCGTACLDFISDDAKNKMRLEIQRLKAANQNPESTKTN